MSAPTVQDIRDFLEAYWVDKDIISDKWILDRMNKFVIPTVERYTRSAFGRVDTVTEYYSGNGKNILFLDRRNVVEILKIRYVLGGNYYTVINLGNIELIGPEGVIKSKSNYSEAYYMPIFAKGDRNLEIEYTYGFASWPDDIKEAVIYLTSEQVLGFIGARTGGGSTTVQGHSKNYGPRGMFSDIRNDLARQAYDILSHYSTAVTG